MVVACTVWLWLEHADWLWLARKEEGAIPLSANALFDLQSCPPEVCMLADHDLEDIARSQLATYEGHQEREEEKKDS